MGGIGWVVTALPNSKARLRAVVLAALFACLAPKALARQAGGAASEAFPLSPGTYWVYRGMVRWAKEGSREPQEKEVEWKMEVERVIRRGTLLAAVIRGHPRDLDWSTGNAEPGNYVIVESAGTKFYLVQPEAFPVAMARLADAKDSLDGLVNDDELFLDLPLRFGKKFCDAAGMQRDDNFYCWVVDQPESVSLDGVKGVPSRMATGFPVRFITMPDSTNFEFVPGIGITSYEYRHHGTTADTELKIVEFHPGTP